MSFKALAWVVDQRPARSTDKLLLYGLADRHSTEDNLAWPSIAWLVEFSGLDRKTVQAGLVRLQDSGHITDTGERKGKTASVRIFRLNLNDTLRDAEERTGMAGENKRSRKRDSYGSGPVFTLKRSRKRDTEPIREPPTSEANASSVAARKGHPVDNFVPVLTPEGQAVAGRHTPEWLEVQLELFKDYYRCHGKRLKDWNAGFRNWLRNAERFEERDNGKPTGNSEPSNPMARAALARGVARGARVDEVATGFAANSGPGNARPLAGPSRPF